MRVETHSSGDVFEARLCERMAFSDHGQFRALLNEIAQAAPKKCVLDLSSLASIDSAGLGMFMIAHDVGKKGGWSLTLRAPQPHVRSLLELGKFDKLLTIEP